MVKENKILLPSLVALAILLFIFIAKGNLFTDRQKIYNPTREQVNTQTTQNPEANGDVESTRSVGVQFQSSTMELSTDQTGTATVMLGEGEDIPTAFYLHLGYDPNEISVQNVEVGEIWENNNILQEEVNNESGEIEMSVGQGFDAEKTGSRDMLNIEFEILDNVDADEVSLNIEADSMMYYVGLDRGVPVNSVPLRININ